MIVAENQDLLKIESRIKKPREQSKAVDGCPASIGVPVAPEKVRAVE